MSVVLLVLYIAVSIFILLMLIRFILELVVSVTRGWRPSGFSLVLAEITYSVTDPPIKVVRRIIPPLNIGGLIFDVASIIVLVVALVASSLLSLSAGFRF